MRTPRLRGLLFLLVLWLAWPARAEVPVPPLAARVTDQTGTLGAQQRAGLEAELQGLEARSGAQLAVLLVPTTQPESIEQYSIRVAEQWKLGRKGNDDGLLILVAKNDRKIRIEVGYGLEGTIPDVVAKRIIDETITPRFKQGDFAGGLHEGVQRLAGLIEGRKAAPPAPEAAAAPRGDPRSVANPARLWAAMDLTDSLPEDTVWRAGRELEEFYDSGRTKPTAILIVPTTQPEPIAQYAERVLKGWGETDNLDVDRSLLLVISRDERTAAVATGAGLGQRLAPGAADALVKEKLEPLLRKGELGPALQAAVQGVEQMVDYAVKNKTLEERLVENVGEAPLWVLLVIVAFGTLLRWALGPLFGGLATGGIVGAGAWYVSGVAEIAVFAAIAAFVFVLVGLANWLAWGISSVGSGGGSSGGGGFSGGGGGFGGGGASGSW